MICLRSLQKKLRRIIMSQKQFTSFYTNDSKYVKEYIQATLKPYTKIMLLCAVIAFAFAGATIALRIQTTISILFLLLGGCLLLDVYYFSWHRAYRKTIKGYKQLYSKVDVPVEAKIDDKGVHYTVNGKTLSYSYDEIDRIEGTKHLIVFICKKRVVPFLKESFSKGQLQMLKQFVNKKGKQIKY